MAIVSSEDVARLNIPRNVLQPAGKSSHDGGTIAATHSTRFTACDQNRYRTFRRLKTH